MRRTRSGRNDVLRAGVIGLGVGEQHIRGYQVDSRCQVVALCDLDKAKLEEVGERNPGISLLDSPEDLLTDPDIDVVSIASYDHAHHDQIILALDHNKHVFVEKPLCLTRRQLDSIARVLRKSPHLQLSSNLILRRTPRFLELRRRILNGDLGQIYFTEGDYDYGRLHKLTQGWRGESPDYSVVHGGGIHVIDLLLWLTGDKVTEVFAYGNRISTQSSAFVGDDMVISALKFSSGLVAKISANFGSVTPHHHRLSVYGTEGTFTQNHLGGAYFWSRDPNVEPEPVSGPYPDAAKGDMIASFVASILDGSRPEVTSSEVFRAMDVSLAIVESLKRGKPVTIRNEKWWSL